MKLGKYTVVAKGWSNSRAWGHLAYVIDEAGSVISEAKIRYYNRTWESYQYQSVMKAAFYNLVSSCENKIYQDYKTRSGAKRLTKEGKRMLLASSHEYKQLMNLYNRI